MVTDKLCKERMGTLKEDISEMKGDIKDMKNNHLKHIEEKLNKHSKKMAIIESKIDKGNDNKKPWIAIITSLISIILILVQIIRGG